MGQDHGDLEPRNQGSQGKESALHVRTETAGKQRSVVKDRERESCIDTDTHTNRQTERDTVNNLY